MPYALGAVRTHVRAAAEKIGPMFGITSILGVGLRANESDHPLGLALDFMTKDKAKGDALAEHVKTNASAYGVTYVIWWGKIWSVGRNAEGWRVYKHPAGLTTDTALHKDHVHVSFNAQPGTGVPTQNETGTGSGGICGPLLLAGIFSVSGFAYAIRQLIGG
jgi:hypothetical protein